MSGIGTREMHRRGTFLIDRELVWRRPYFIRRLAGFDERKKGNRTRGPCRIEEAPSENRPSMIYDFEDRLL